MLLRLSTTTRKRGQTPLFKCWTSDVRLLKNPRPDAGARLRTRALNLTTSNSGRTVVIHTHTNANHGIKRQKRLLCKVMRARTYLFFLLAIFGVALLVATPYTSHATTVPDPSSWRPPHYLSQDFLGETQRHTYPQT